MGVKLTKDKKTGKLVMESSEHAVPTINGVQTLNTVDTEDGPLPLQVFKIDGSVEEIVPGESATKKLMQKPPAKIIDYDGEIPKGWKPSIKIKPKLEAPTVQVTMPNISKEALKMALLGAGPSLLDTASQFKMLGSSLEELGGGEFMKQLIASTPNHPNCKSVFEKSEKSPMFKIKEHKFIPKGEVWAIGDDVFSGLGDHKSLGKITNVLHDSAQVELSKEGMELFEALGGPAAVQSQIESTIAKKMAAAIDQDIMDALTYAGTSHHTTSSNSPNMQQLPKLSGIKKAMEAMNEKKGVMSAGFAYGGMPKENLKMPSGTHHMEIQPGNGANMVTFYCAHGMRVQDTFANWEYEKLLSQHGKDEALEKLFEQATRRGLFYPENEMLDCKVEKDYDFKTMTDNYVLVSLHKTGTVMVGGHATGQINHSQDDMAKTVVFDHPLSSKLNPLSTWKETTEQTEQIYRRVRLQYVLDKEPGPKGKMMRKILYWSIFLHDSVPEGFEYKAFEAVLEEFPHVRVMPAYYRVWEIIRG